ncbi:MAG: ribosome biogenesis GTPase Der [Clostridia bacterium]|nr:ribosome biogenesis GTPase Der [Clostridia bacterium]MDY4083861.1 ribosome biogenesis GTPase Der [Eubacteriales bacterium]
MSKPLVAIVGRPNVGKSTLFNRIVGKKVSIVEDMEGVTRDRLYCDAEWCGYNFTLVDTGGLEIKSQDKMWQHIRAQAQMAVDIADVIVYVADGKSGLTANDYEVAEFLRGCNKPIVVAVNKLDNNETENSFDFYELGLGTVVAISAEQSKGIGDLLDEVVEHLPKYDTQQDEGKLNVAIVGKPNAGKSSITNRILGYDRVIVSNVAGTTRDAIDTDFEWQGKKFNIIDTAGIRKKSSVEEGVEQYSVMRSLAAIRRADVVLVVIDTQEGLSEQDVKICGYAHEQGKPSVIVMNKWDTIEKDTYTVNTFNKKILTELKFMDYFVAEYVSAKTGQRIEKLLSKALEVYEEASKRIATGVLNDVVQDATIAVEPPSDNGKRLKVYYVTQASTNPPTFVFFVNDTKLLHFSYERYLENALRKAFTFKGTPIRILVRNKSEKDI